jgi:progressive ankylosis protein
MAADGTRLTTTSNSPAQPTRVGDAYRFFMPLMLMAELMMISHAIIAAFLARMEHPEPVLAAYSVSFAFHATLGAPVWACQIVFLSFMRDRQTIRRLFTFGLQAFASVAWLWLLLSITPMGDWVFRELFGVSEEVATQAKLCLLLSIIIPPTSILRSLSYSLLMSERRTIWVTAGTIVRLIGLAGLLSVITLWFEGAVVGVVALAGCITIETVVALLIAWPAYLRLSETAGALPSYRELWRFSWPIMIMQVAESGVLLATNFFLGRLDRAELALASFAVLESIMRVILSPLRNLIHTTQTLVKTRHDAKVMLIFTAHMAALFGGVTLLFYVPWIRTWVLFDVMGMPSHMAEYVVSALRISFMLALGMAAAGLARGLLIASKNTGAIAVSSGVRVAAVILTGVIGLTTGASNGAMLGMLALVLAFGSEATVLGIRLVQLDRRSPLFSDPR